MGIETNMPMPLNIPPKVGGLLAVGGVGTFDASWVRVVQATYGYHVELFNAADDTLVAEVTRKNVLTYQFTGLDAGNYYFKVRAVAGGGQSPASNPSNTVIVGAAAGPSLDYAFAADGANDGTLGNDFDLTLTDCVAAGGVLTENQNPDTSDASTVEPLPVSAATTKLTALLRVTVNPVDASDDYHEFLSWQLGAVLLTLGMDRAVPQPPPEDGPPRIFLTYGPALFTPVATAAGVEVKIALVFDGAVVTLYVDDVLSATGAWAGFVDADAFFALSPFTGEMGRFRLWIDQALTAEQLEAL